MKRVISALIVAMLLVTTLTGCGSKQDPLVGRWVEDAEAGEVIELFSDGTGVLSSSTEQYTITSWLGENGRLKVTMQVPLFGEYTVTRDYEVTQSTLKLIEGEDVTVYNKQN